MPQGNLISHHIFLFPFKWTVDTSKVNVHNAERNLEKVHSSLDSQVWIPFAFQYGVNESVTFNTYNEYAYFHDYARDILSLDIDGSVSKKQYAYKLLTDAKYKIDILGGDTFELEIEDISLNFYETGVGIIAFHLNNNEPLTFDKALKINEYGRRIYPQYLGSGVYENNPTTYTSATKNNFLPNALELLNFGKPILEDFSHYDDLEKITEHPFKLPNHIQELLGDNFSTKKYDKQKKIIIQQGKIILEPIIDDRMFTMSFFVDSERLKILRGYDEDTKSYNWENSPDWHRYIFIDDSTASCQSKRMMPNILEPCTYDRWIDNKDKGDSIGHIFGITRYSFCILADDCFFTNTILKHHFKSQYFQMAQLVLVQRASILNFSAEVSEISKSPRANKVSDLYLRYIKFINKIYFREITPQEQGIELYKMLHARMDIEQNVKDLDAEIKELHDYVALKDGEYRSSRLNLLTIIGFIFLPASFVLSFLGMNYFGSGALQVNDYINHSNKVDDNSHSVIWVAIIIGLTILLSLLIWVIIRYLKSFWTFISKNKTI